MFTQDDYSAHEQIFSGGYCLNLRTVGDEQLCVYTLTETTTRTLRGKKKVIITDLVPGISEKPKCTLTLDLNTMHKAKYTGSHNDGMGNRVSYEMYIRTDITNDLRKKDIIARVQIIRGERINRLLYPWTNIICEYDIYSPAWENRQRPSEPSF